VAHRIIFLRILRKILSGRTSLSGGGTFSTRAVFSPSSSGRAISVTANTIESLEVASSFSSIISGAVGTGSISHKSTILRAAT
jgi:hypothetical protein